MLGVSPADLCVERHTCRDDTKPQLLNCSLACRRAEDSPKAPELENEKPPSSPAGSPASGDQYSPVLLKV